jgi:glycosyltransferase involved in cell wall biosynthesis
VLKTTNPVIRPFDRSRLKKFYRRHLYGFVFSNFGEVLTLSDEERDTLSRLYPQQKGKFLVATNPYITPEMLSGYERVPRSGPPGILTLARMMPQKRLDILLAAFAQVSRPDWTLTILGDGPERPRLEALAKSLGIDDRVEMPGFVDDVVPWLRNADLLALSSDYEGLPAAVLEALACNLPVVTTDCFDGARSLLAHAPGCAVVPRGSPAALAYAIDQSLADRGNVTGLRDIARGYGFEAAIASHLRALRPLLP